MSRQSVIEEGIRRLNEGGNLEAWGRRARVSEVNEVASRVGVEVRTTKAATVSAIARAPRPAVVDAGFSALTSGRSISAWGRRARAAEVRALAERLGLAPQGTKATLLRAIEAVAEQARIIERQAQGFPRALERHVKAVESLFVQARARLFQDLSSVSATTAPGKMAAFNRIIRSWGTALKAAMKQQLAKAEADMHDLATKHFRELFDFDRARGRLRSRRALRLYNAAVDKLMAEMAIRLTRLASIHIGKTPAQIARGLAGKAKRSTVNAYRHRARLTARMETLRAYNEAQIELAMAMSAPSGTQFRKRIAEMFDDRNHPFSRAADGTVAPLQEPFEVSVAEVQREAMTLGKSAAGVFWPIQNGNYVGMSLPAHYSDRGRVVVELVAL